MDGELSGAKRLTRKRAGSKRHSKSPISSICPQTGQQSIPGLLLGLRVTEQRAMQNEGPVGLRMTGSPLQWRLSRAVLQRTPYHARAEQNPRLPGPVLRVFVVEAPTLAVEFNKSLLILYELSSAGYFINLAMQNCYFSISSSLNAKGRQRKHDLVKGVMYSLGSQNTAPTS